MTQYGIIAALVALILFPIAQHVGARMDSTFCHVAAYLSGPHAVTVCKH